MINEQWIKGQPLSLSREAVQIELPDGQRRIVLCPACGNGAHGAIRYRSLWPELKQAYINGVARNAEGERLKSKCCNYDMVTMRDGAYACLRCLLPTDAK